MSKKCAHVLIGKWETTSSKLESIGDWSKDFANASKLTYKVESRLVSVRTCEKIFISNFEKSILGQWMWRMNLYPVLSEEKERERERGGVEGEVNISGMYGVNLELCYLKTVAYLFL